MKPGATGDFPNGKLTPDDEGGIHIAVGARDGRVIIEFGKRVAWIGFSPAEARALAAALEKHARVAEPPR